MRRLMPEVIALTTGLAVSLAVLPGCNDGGNGSTPESEENGAAVAPSSSEESPPPTDDEPRRVEAPEPQPDLANELFAAMAADDEARAIELVKQGAPIDARNANGVPVLFLAAGGCFECESAMVDLTRLLLEYGADPETSISRGLQTIHWAARTGATGRLGSEEVVDLLLQYGADINARAAAGTRPIDFAMRTDNTEWAQFLVSRGASVN